MAFFSDFFEDNFPGIALHITQKTPAIAGAS